MLAMSILQVPVAAAGPASAFNHSDTFVRCRFVSAHACPLPTTAARQPYSIRRPDNIDCDVLVVSVLLVWDVNSMILCRGRGGGTACVFTKSSSNHRNFYINITKLENLN